MFISAVDSTIVNVALPAISRDLDARVGALQWVIDGFLVCLAGMLLVGSGLADHFGRRKVFLLGLAGFGAASVLAAASQNVAELIATRVLMGAAAACVLPPALSLIAVMFSPEERPRALAVWTAVAGVGFALGPVLGGVLVQSVGWQAVFLVNVPVLVAAVPLGVVSLPESRRPGMPPLDLIGVGLSVIALALVVFALIEGVPLGWSNPAVLAAAAGGFAAGVAFVRVELVRRAPLFDVTALLRPVVATGAIVIVAVYISFLGVLFLLPQYLYYVRHESTLFSGLLLAPARTHHPGGSASRSATDRRGRQAHDGRRRTRRDVRGGGGAVADPPRHRSALRGARRGGVWRHDPSDPHPGDRGDHGGPR
jgi:EmrB/QacA subfamily drug resistance transporter